MLNWYALHHTYKVLPMKDSFYIVPLLTYVWEWTNHFECCDKEYIFINLTIWWLIFSCVLKHNGESTITSALYGFQQTSKLFSLWAWWPYPRWPVLSINDTVVTWSWSSRGWKPSKQFTGLFFMHGLYFQLTKKLIKISKTGGRQGA